MEALVWDESIDSEDGTYERVEKVGDCLTLEFDCFDSKLFIIIGPTRVQIEEVASGIEGCED